MLPWTVPIIRLSSISLTISLLLWPSQPSASSCSSYLSSSSSSRLLPRLLPSRSVAHRLRRARRCICRCFVRLCRLRLTCSVDHRCHRNQIASMSCEGAQGPSPETVDGRIFASGKLLVHTVRRGPASSLPPRPPLFNVEVTALSGAFCSENI